MTDERGKRPVWFSRPDGDLFAFAGIWAALPRKGTDDVLHSCAIVTTRAERAHPPDPRPDAGAPRARPRRPTGSTPSAPSTSCSRCSSRRREDALIAREVSDLVNDVREDGPRLIEPREEQGVLF